jgi:hypothetical protein
MLQQQRDLCHDRHPGRVGSADDQQHDLVDHLDRRHRRCFVRRRQEARQEVFTPRPPSIPQRTLHVIAKVAGSGVRRRYREIATSLRSSR